MISFMALTCTERTAQHPLRDRIQLVNQAAAYMAQLPEGPKAIKTENHFNVSQRCAPRFDHTWGHNGLQPDEVGHVVGLFRQVRALVLPK